MRILTIFCTFALFTVVTGEWIQDDCSGKDFVRAVYVSEEYIKALLPSTVTYSVDHLLKCMRDTSGELELFGLSIYGRDTTRTAYVHNMIVSKDINGDFKVESKQLVSSKTAAELDKYPYQDILYYFFLFQQTCKFTCANSCGLIVTESVQLSVL